MYDTHSKIVDEILPRLAEKLKREGMISDYSHKQEPIKISENLPEIRINPDLVLDLPNGKKILVEVVNPKDPKRFIGELIYPGILIHQKRIVATLFFVLNPRKQEMQRRSLSQTIVLHEFLNIPKGSRTVGWPGEDAAYGWLKNFVKKFSLKLGSKVLVGLTIENKKRTKKYP